MERKNGDVALCPHFSEVPKTKNRDTGLPPHFSSGPKFKMTHYRNLTRISHRFVTIHNQVPLPLGEGAAKRRGRVNGVHSYRPSPGLRPPPPPGGGTAPRPSCPSFRGAK